MFCKQDVLRLTAALEEKVSLYATIIKCISKMVKYKVWEKNNWKVKPQDDEDLVFVKTAILNCKEFSTSYKCDVYSLVDE